MKEQDFRAIVIGWLIALTMIWVVVLACWTPICRKAASTVVWSALKEAPRHAGYESYAAEPNYADRSKRDLDEWGRKIQRESDEAMRKLKE